MMMTMMKTMKKRVSMKEASDSAFRVFVNLSFLYWMEGSGLQILGKTDIWFEILVPDVPPCKMKSNFILPTTTTTYIKYKYCFCFYD